MRYWGACGRKCAREALVLCQKPKMTVLAHKAVAIPRFIDSCVVGVNEGGFNLGDLLNQ